MCGSVFKDKSGVDDWVASLRAFLASFVEGFADSSDKFRRNICSNNFIYKLVSSLIATRIDRFNVSDDSCILTCTTRLLFVQVIKTMPLSDSFPVVDAWLAGLAINSKLSFYSLDVNLKV